MIFSIVTPSFNQGLFIERTLCSVLTQVGDFDLEYIIVDGGSSDNTIDILKRTEKMVHSKSFKPRCNNLSFQWLSEKDGGQADALTKGFSLSTGELLGWLNSDDVYLRPDTLSTAYRVFIQSNTDIVVGNARLIDEYDKVLNSPIMINGLNDIQFQRKLASLHRLSIIAFPGCRSPASLENSLFM